VCVCVSTSLHIITCSLYSFVGNRSFINQHIPDLEQKHKDELKAKDERIAKLMKVMYARTS
jgi:hypothetical protein